LSLHYQSFLDLFLMQSVIGSGSLLGKSGEVPFSDLKADVIGLYFSAHWCGPCRAFTPTLAKVYNEMKAANKNFEIVFVSSDRAQSAFDEYYRTMPWLALPFGDKRKNVLSSAFQVAGIPTLIVLRKDGTMISNTARADINNLGVRAFDKWAESGEEKNGSSAGSPSLSSLIDMSQTQCLNQSSEHTWKDLLSKGNKGAKYLESDADEQLLLTVAFKSEVAIRSISLQSTKDGRAPKHFKLFLNNTHMDFNDAESETAIQEFTLSDKDYKEVPENKDDIGTELILSTKFKKIRALTIFVSSNMGKKDTTMISGLSFLSGDKKEDEKPKN